MRLAGYPMPDAGDGPGAVLAGAQQLTDEERAEIEGIIALKLRRRRAAQASDSSNGGQLSAMGGRRHGSADPNTRRPVR